MINLINIDFEYWQQDWQKTIGQQPVYTNKNVSQYSEFNGTTLDCSNEIKRLVKLDLDKSRVLKIIDLIYQWGGRSGRMFYSKNKAGLIPRQLIECDMEIYNTYIKGVELAKSGNADSKLFFEKVPGIGPSYASKHSYFWSLHSEKVLMILDSKIAGCLGYSNIENLNRNVSYEQVLRAFVARSKEVFNKNDPSLVEQAFFSFHNFYFKNDNSNWKKGKLDEHGVDKNIADKLATVLF